MWLYDKQQPDLCEIHALPLLHIGQFSYMPHPLSWLKYPHIHQEEYELSYIISGHGVVHLPGQIHSLERGNIVLVPPKTAHFYQSKEGEDLEYYALRIRHLEDVPEATTELDTLGCCIAKSRHMNQLQSLLELISDLARQNGGVIDRTIHILCLAIWEISCQEFKQTGESIEISIPEYTNDILCYLHDNVHRKITLADLAQKFNLSASHISRVFSNAYHISPINYLIMARMARARTYILNEGLSSTEIAKRLAYNDTYQFINAFVKFFGCRPENYYELVKRTEE